MSIPEEILEVLRTAGLVKGAAPLATPLSGGVSCDIWCIEGTGRRFVVKRALPKLRVAAEWFADTSRNQHEQEYLRYVAQVLPDAVPAVLLNGADFFAMEFLGDGYADWKKQLLSGETDPETAQAAGMILGRIHSRSWLDEQAGRRFANDRHFFELRIEPYLLQTADKHPDLAEVIRGEARRLEATKCALVHGDYSPKNLMVAQGRLVVLDCEVAWFGDPAFDVCFLLNHLLLKSLFRPGKARDVIGLVAAFLESYGTELGQERSGTVFRVCPTLLLCLLLARIDGKSPVEYLKEPRQQEFVRSFARRHLSSVPETVSELIERWKQSLALYEN